LSTHCVSRPVSLNLVSNCFMPPKHCAYGHTYHNPNIPAQAPDRRLPGAVAGQPQHELPRRRRLDGQLPRGRRQLPGAFPGAGHRLPGGARDAAGLRPPGWVPNRLHRPEEGGWGPGAASTCQKMGSRGPSASHELPLLAGEASEEGSPKLPSLQGCQEWVRRKPWRSFQLRSLQGCQEWVKREPWRSFHPPFPAADMRTHGAAPRPAPSSPPGRALESRAKVQAASDLKALAHLIPATARLQLDPGAAPGAKPGADGRGPAVEYIQVSTRSVRAGDVVRVLPGETARVPRGCQAVACALIGAGRSACARVGGWCGAGGSKRAAAALNHAVRPHHKTHTETHTHTHHTHLSRRPLDKCTSNTLARAHTHTHTHTHTSTHTHRHTLTCMRPHPLCVCRRRARPS
jgi:hypothetical protein